MTFKDGKRAPLTVLINVKQIYTLGRKDNNNTDSYWLSVPQVISDRDSDIIKNYCPRHSFAQDQGQKSTLTAKC